MFFLLSEIPSWRGCCCLNLPWVNLCSDNSLCLKIKLKGKRIGKNVSTSLGYQMCWKICYSCILLPGLSPINTVRASTETENLNDLGIGHTGILLVTAHLHVINKYFMKNRLIITPNVNKWKLPFVPQIRNPRVWVFWKVSFSYVDIKRYRTQK